MNERIEQFILSISALVFCVATNTVQSADGGSSAGEPGASDRPVVEPASELANPYEPTARWLLNRPDARQRAAGLLYLSSSMLDGGELDAEALLDEFERSIRTTTDGAALAWLATACASAGITDFCVDAGLDDAIVRHDKSNLFSRLALIPHADCDSDTNAEARKHLLLDARSSRSYLNDLTGIWFRALDSGPGMDALQTAHEKLIGALSISIAYAIPGYQYLSTACTDQAEAGSELERACTRILNDLSLGADSLADERISAGIKANRAEQRGESEEAATLKQRNVYEMARTTCIHQEFESLSANSEAVTREYVRLLVEHGESEAVNGLARRYGIDCSDPSDPAAEALERYATQLEREAGQGK